VAEGAGGTLTLGIDLGTSAVKVLALDERGVVQGTATAEFATLSELPGQAEQDPADWAAALARAAAALAGSLESRGGPSLDSVVAIGVCGQLPTLVCLGAEGVLGRAITWKDARADLWTSTALSDEERRAHYLQTGMPLDGRYLGPMFRCHFGDRADVATVFSAKDYLCYLLTGERVTAVTRSPVSR